MSESPINNRKVLVLESRPDALDFIVEYLKELELEVEVFHEASELLSQAENPRSRRSLSTCFTVCPTLSALFNVSPSHH